MLFEGQLPKTLYILIKQIEASSTS